jgi:hypothetical protein
MLPTIMTADLHTLIPELFVCAAAFALLMVDLFLSPQRRGLTHFLALLILVAAAVLTARDMASTPTFAFSQFFVRDTAGDVLKMALYGVTALVFVYAKPYLQDRDLFKGEFHVLVLFAMLGMMLMISAQGLGDALSGPGVAGPEFLRSGRHGSRQPDRLGSGDEVFHPRLARVRTALVRHVDDLRRDRQPAARRDKRRRG